jgi:hypothetical protein
VSRALAVGAACSRVCRLRLRLQAMQEGGGLFGMAAAKRGSTEAARSSCENRGTSFDRW